MILRDYINQIISAQGAGIDTTDSRFAELRIEDLLPQWRQSAMSILYNGNRQQAKNHQINAENYQPIDIVINRAIQPKTTSYKIFECPNVISLNDEANGFINVCDMDSGRAFIQLRNASDYSNKQDARLIDINEVYFYKGGRYLYVRGNTGVTTLHLDIIASNPVLVPGFDPETDNYPMSEDVFSIVKTLAYAELNPQERSLPDFIQDGIDSTVRRALKQQSL